MQVLIRRHFENWADTVKNTPSYTFLPKTVLGVRNIVKFAASKGLRVRCGGHRLSWSPIFGEDGGVFISFLDPARATGIPDPSTIMPDVDNSPSASELKRIQLLRRTNGNHSLVRIGASVTNEELRRWSIKNSYTLPVNTVVAEGTVVGSVSSISHGAGRAHKTLSDYVRRVEYVDINGELQIVDDIEQVKAAAGSFGLLGVITHITYEMEPMIYAVMQPRKVDIGLAIPPIEKEEIPLALRGSWYNEADAESRIAVAFAEFEKKALFDHYSEWLWFPFQQRVWQQTWSPTADPEGDTGYPNKAETYRHWLETVAGGLLSASPVFRAIPDKQQVELLASFGMASSPPIYSDTKKPTIKTALPNALHYRRGPANVPVRNMEFQIPLPPHPDDPSRPDLSIVRKAWWDVVKLVYAHAEKDSYPMRLVLEMRIMGDSDVFLAPQRGNSLGTLSIGIVSTVDAVYDKQWSGFCQEVADLWTSYGAELNVRPHWAKEWADLRVRGQPVVDYLRDVAFKEQIADFKRTVSAMGKMQGWTLNELQQRFSNPVWDQIIFKE